MHGLLGSCHGAFGAGTLDMSVFAMNGRHGVRGFVTVTLARRVERGFVKDGEWINGLD